MHASSPNTASNLAIFIRDDQKPNIPVFCVEIASTAYVNNLTESIISSGPAITLSTQLKIMFVDQLLTDHDSLLSDICITPESTITYSLKDDYFQLIVSIQTKEGCCFDNFYLGHFKLPCTDFETQIKVLKMQWSQQNCPTIRLLPSDEYVFF